MLTLAEANQVVQGALARAKELNIKISVAVCDAGGRLVAFNRMDGALWAGAYGSQGKAIASAAFARPSGELQERAGSPIIQGIAAAEGGHMIASQGAVPFASGRRQAQPSPLWQSRSSASRSACRSTIEAATTSGARPIEHQPIILMPSR